MELPKLTAGSVQKALKNFWYGKPHTAEEGGRRLGDLKIPKTGLYKHREWRGFADTMYYFNMIWLYNYGCVVKGILENGGVVNVAKGLWRYRWMGQTYTTVAHWLDRGLEGLRGEALRASGWHYNALVVQTIVQFMTMFAADTKLRGGKKNYDYYHTIGHGETVWGGMFYPWSDRYKNVSNEMVTYFLTAHTNAHVVHNYIDAAQGIGVPGDNCPMCQAESGIYIMDDVPDYSPFIIPCNEACDDSTATSILQDWLDDKPLFALTIPMRFDDPLLKEDLVNEIKQCWKFVEEQTGAPFNWDQLVKKLELQNQLQRFEWEKWEVAANTPYYPVNSVAQALYRIFYTQYGDAEIWHFVDKKVRKIMERCVEKKINTFPNTRHRAIAWSCAPLYYSYWCTWAYNCWGVNTIINMDSLMFDMEIRTDSFDHCVEDMAQYHMWAPMRRNAVGGMHHFFQLWERMEQFNCDMVIMYDQLQCKGAQAMHGLFEDEFRKRNIPVIWMPHALPDSRVVSRMEIRRIFNDYMTTVMHEEPLDPSLLEFDDTDTW